MVERYEACYISGDTDKMYVLDTDYKLLMDECIDLRIRLGFRDDLIRECEKLIHGLKAALHLINDAANTYGVRSEQMVDAIYAALQRK